MASILDAPVRAATAEPLRTGDVLDQPTFHQRYERMPRGFQAELIEGVVYVPSPATNWHGLYQGAIIGWLFSYSAATPGVYAIDNGTVILDEENEPQPDAVLRRGSGGLSDVNQRGFIVGAPELHVEVSYSTESIDLHQKRRSYERAGVQQYIVVLVQEPAVRFFSLQDRTYQEVAADADGIWRSSVFPGLWLNVRALLDRDGKALLETLQSGIKSSEHDSFVERLQRSAH